MGYRNYIYVCDKEKLKEIEDISKSEFLERFVYSPDEPYFSKHKFFKIIDAKQVFNFGKYIDWTDKIKPYMSNIFKNEELNKKTNQEEELVKLDYNALRTICEIYKQKIIDWFKELANEEDKKKLEFSIKNKISEWRMMETKPITQYELTSSWKYEYEYFTLLHIMTQIDTENEVLLWLGW